ncbi:MAG: (Fe-S)-binding protein [Candidatus Njordarchaeia archaeon]
MLPLQEVHNVLIRNILKRGYPFPMDERSVYNWAIELNVPRKGEYIIYTSGMYQMVPYINATVNLLEKAEKSAFYRFMFRLYGKIGFMDRFSGLLIRPSRVDKVAVTNIVRTIYFMLRKARVSVGYLYEDDIYSGALLHDLGLDALLEEHLNKLSQIFKKHGAKKIVTFDPHTLNIVRSVMPQFVEDYDYEAYSYLELLESKLKDIKIRNKNNKLTVTIQDPCLYARRENVIEPQRNLLEASGIKVVEARRSGKATGCCGGPVESLAPSFSKKVAIARLNELKEASKNIVVMCPICLANLGRFSREVGVDLRDLSEILYSHLFSQS